MRNLVDYPQGSIGHMRVVQFFHDPTDGVINQRIVLSMMRIAEECTDLTKEEKEEFWITLLYVGWKLVATWTHFHRYGTIEDARIAAVWNRPALQLQKVQEIRYDQELFLEVDEFLVQVKSTLDALVKIPIPIFGKRAWTLRTFSDKGQDVAKALLNNIPRKHKDRAKGIIEIVVKKYSAWLTDIIHQRDNVNHFLEGGMNMDAFVVMKQLIDGKEVLHVPMWSEKQTSREALNIGWENLIRLVEDFIGCFLGFRLKDDLAMIHGKGDSDPTKSLWIVTTKEEYDRIAYKPGWYSIGVDEK